MSTTGAIITAAEHAAMAATLLTEVRSFDNIKLGNDIHDVSTDFLTPESTLFSLEKPTFSALHL